LAEFRVTSYAQIERWWEMVMSAYLKRQFAHELVASTSSAKLTQHPGWNRANSWKQVLNNLRLVIQPSVIQICFNPG